MEKSTISALPRECSLRQRARGTGPQGRVVGAPGEGEGSEPEVAQNFLKSSGGSRVSKKKGYPSGSVVERNATGGLVFYVPFT